MNTKTLVTTVFILLFIGNASAAITSVDIVNMFPDEESLDRATQVVVRISSDTTATTTVGAWVQVPDGNYTMDGQETVTVKQNIPRELSLRFAAEDFTQYGPYTIIVNETNNGNEDRFNFTITPRPEVNINVGDAIKHPLETNLDYVHVNINPLIGRSIGGDDLSATNLTLRRVIGNQTFPTGVQKETVLTQEMGISNDTNDLEAVIDLNGLEPAAYELFVAFNISSCDSCPSFREFESISLRVQEDSVNTMSVQIGVILSLLLTGFLFAFLGSRFNQSNGAANVLRVFMFLLAPLFAVFAVFTAGHFATQGGFSGVGNYMNYVFLGTFFAWFFFVFVVGVLMYVNEAIRMSVMGVLTGRDPESV